MYHSFWTTSLIVRSWGKREREGERKRRVNVGKREGDKIEGLRKEWRREDKEECEKSLKGKGKGKKVKNRRRKGAAVIHKRDEQERNTSFIFCSCVL